MAMKKRGVSEVVTTVLLVVISIVAVALVAGFIIPMVRNSLERGASCLNLQDYVKAVDIGYTCYNSTNTIISVERGMENESISGIVVSITSGASSKRYNIINNKNDSNILMYNGTSLIDEEELPEPGEVKTYIFNLASGTKADVAAITKSKTCEASSFTIRSC